MARLDSARSEVQENFDVVQFGQKVSFRMILRFFDFRVKKLRLQGLDFLFNNFLFIVWGVPLSAKPSRFELAGADLEHFRPASFLNVILQE